MTHDQLEKPCERRVCGLALEGPQFVCGAKAGEPCRGQTPRIEDGLYAQLRNGVQVGPLKKSPMWDLTFFDPVGYHWDARGTLVGFSPGGNLDIVKTAATPEDL